MKPIAAIALLPFVGPSTAPLAGVSYELPLPGPVTALVCRPLDAGPTPDVAVVVRTGANEVALLSASGLGDGNLRFGPVLRLQQLGYAIDPELAAGDLDGDGYPALGATSVSSNGLFDGDGDLFYAQDAWIPTAGGSQHGLDFVDWDGDGDLDSAMLVADIGGYFVDVGLNDGSGNLSLNVFVAAPLATGFDSQLLMVDVTGSGIPSTFAVGPGGFAVNRSPDGPQQIEFLFAGNVARAVTADLNGDGSPDFALADRDLGVQVLLNDGSGGFPAATTVALGAGAEGLAAADLDGDGVLDLAVTDADDDLVRILRGDGAGGFDRVGARPVGDRPESVVGADLDLNGRADLIVANGGTNSLSVLLNPAGG